MMVKEGIRLKINKTKIIAYSGILALLASMIIGLLGFSNNTRDIEHIKNQLLTMHVENNIKLSLKYILSSYGTLTHGNGTLLDENGNSIEGKYGVVDSVLEDVGDQSTIFVKVNNDFKRISTNVMSSENERAIGTYLGTDHNAYDTVMRGDIYIGEAKILGDNYYTAYDPIKDENNNVIGLLFVGVQTEKLDAIINVHDTKMNNIDILIIIFRTISLGALIALVATATSSSKPAQGSPPLTKQSLNTTPPEDSKA